MQVFQISLKYYWSLANNMSEIFSVAAGCSRHHATAEHRLRIIETYTFLW